MPELPDLPSFALNLREQQLYRDGKAVALPPRAYDLLRLLVQHPRHLLTKDEILDQVWAGTHVSEASIKDYVKELRQILGDDATTPRYIETVRGRGYRFVGDIGIIGEPSRSEPSIVVFPFHDSNGDGRSYFSDGISEDICVALGRYRQLVVISPFSAFPAVDKWATLEEAARGLGAHWMLTGRVTRMSGELLLAVRLIEIITQRQVWAERYTRTLDDVLEVQDEIVRSIVATIVGQLDRAHTARALREDPALLSAYELVLRGRAQLAKATRADVLLARETFEHAVTEHPDCVAGYVWLAESYYLEANSSWTPSAEQAAERAFVLGRRAVEIDELDSSAHLTVAWGYFRQGNLALAKAELDRVLELNPNDYYGLCFQSTMYLCRGEVDGAIESGLAALRRSPLVSDACLFTLGFAYYFGAAYDRALEIWSRMARPRVEVQAGIAASHAQLGRRDEAEAALEVFCSAVGVAERSRLAADRHSWRTYWQRVFPLQEARLLEHLLEGLDRAGWSATAFRPC